MTFVVPDSLKHLHSAPYIQLNDSNAITTYQLLLDEETKNRAMKHVDKCKRRNGKKFDDFEKKVESYLTSKTLPTSLMEFEYSFVEYVIVEVCLKNYIKRYPCTTRLDRFVDKAELSMIRAECICLHGASPKYFAKLYHNRINETLFACNKSLSLFSCYRAKAPSKFHKY